MYKIKIILEIAFSSYFNAQQANELDPRNEAWHTKVSIKASDHVGNCPPTPPLSQHFALSEK